MKIKYRIHAKEKLKYPESRKLGLIEELPDNLLRSTSKLIGNYSLVVVYKQEFGKIYKVITFFPATKGRYESKILR